MAEDSDTNLSSASSVLSEMDEDEQAKLEAEIKETKKVKGIGKYFKPTPKTPKLKRETTPEMPKRAPSPPHEFVLADKDAIAFIVMFRSRFSECFATSLPHYGPQDIERGVSGDQLDEQIEKLLCALLSLCLNRKKPVERGHYGRALEEAVAEFRTKDKWPKEWNGVNPVSGSKTFGTMTPEERLLLLRTLVLWSMHGSQLVNDAIKEAYRQNRRADDRNQPKAVQPWFADSWRRKYYLIEGQDDTHFRIYRENEGKMAKTNVWFSVAGTIEEVKALADKFEIEMPGNQGKLLADKVRGAMPRWEAGEEKRKRKEYRAIKKAQFARPEPGYGYYDGRTRGKRMRYTFDDDDNFEVDSDGSGLRRSARDASGRSTDVDESRPIVTASGRQVKPPQQGLYGESLSTDQRRDTETEKAGADEDIDDIVGLNGRSLRKLIPTKRAAAARGRYADGLESESETDADEPNEPSGDEWSGNEDEPDEESDQGQEYDQESDDGLITEDDEDNTQRSHVIKLNYRQKPRPAETNSGSGLAEKTPLSQVQNASDMDGAPPIVNGHGHGQDSAGTMSNGHVETQASHTENGHFGIEKAQQALGQPMNVS